MVIVGIHGNGFCFKDGRMIFSHDSSVTLVVDGRLVGALSHERVTREKYDGAWPQLTLELLLAHHGLKPTDVDIFAYTGNNYNGAAVDMGQVLDACTRLSPKCRVEFFDHHLAHAMASFLSSRFPQASIFTFDNSGDYHMGGAYHNNSTYLLGQQDPLDIMKIYNSRTPAWGPAALSTFQGTFTVGFFYDAMSRVCLRLLDIPLRHQSECSGKVMGLAAYGDHTAVRLPNPFVILQTTEFDFPEIVWNSSIIPDFDRWIDTLRDGQASDIAAWTQWVFEEIMIEFFQRIPPNMRSRNLCLGGGCALNVLLNSRLIRDGLFDDVHVNTAPNDAGLSFGCALLSARKHETDLCLPENIGTIGLSYDDSDIQQAYALYSTHITCTKLQYHDLMANIASRLAHNEIVAWFQGASEFGPRALGNRSILANPSHDNRDLLNSKVKFREHWRPYAAAILQDHVDQWIDCAKSHSDYMLFAGHVIGHKRDLVPSITHHDGSCRVQTVTRPMNHRLFDLLTAFHSITGVPMLLNTSFNTLPGEPIVETPRDAFRSFVNSEIDCMVINDFVFERCSTDSKGFSYD